MATHSSVPAWKIQGTGEPGGLLSLGSHRVGHDWSDLAAAAATVYYNNLCTWFFFSYCIVCAPVQNACSPRQTLTGIGYSHTTGADNLESIVSYSWKAINFSSHHKPNTKQISRHDRPVLSILVASSHKWDGWKSNLFW